MTDSLTWLNLFTIFKINHLTNFYFWSINMSILDLRYKIWLDLPHQGCEQRYKIFIRQKKIVIPNSDLWTTHTFGRFSGSYSNFIKRSWADPAGEDQGGGYPVSAPDGWGFVLIELILNMHISPRKLKIRERWHSYIFFKYIEWCNLTDRLTYVITLWVLF